jgi:membrane protein DedA with SNARE-associated domain
VPADVAVALGAFLAQRGEVNGPLLGALCWLANCGSATWTYVMGRRHGASFFKHGWRRKLLPPEAMKAMRKAYQNYGTLGIFVSRFLPGVRAAVTPFAGVAGLSPARALLPTAVASALWYALLIAAGTLLGNQWSEVRKLVERVTGVLTLVGVLGAIGFFVWLRRRKRGGASS